MPRNYTDLTLKTLFGEASSCAYPNCDEPLILRERDVTTAVAEIAHIRSEVPGGPRHDANYRGDINGAENLLLLCGKHHRVVDRHEDLYPVDELERWKVDQIATAGSGTPLTDADLRSYQRLTDQEREQLKVIARLAQRVINASRAAQRSIDAVRAANEAARDELNDRHLAWTVDEDGKRTRLRSDLPYVEQQKWDRAVQDAFAATWPSIEAAQDALHEEIAVLRMTAGPLAGAGERVHAAAQVVGARVGDAESLATATTGLDASVAQLWQVATGNTDPV